MRWTWVQLGGSLKNGTFPTIDFLFHPKLKNPKLNFNRTFLKNTSVMRASCFNKLLLVLKILCS